ncbi:Uncharacterised protein r2_g2226 [Pycnogonum litorale]
MELPHCSEPVQKYRDQWEKVYPSVITPSNLGEQYARCMICSQDFMISHGRLNDMKKHVATEKHVRNSKSVTGSQKLTSFFRGQASVDDLSVINAEVFLLKALLNMVFQ